MTRENVIEILKAATSDSLNKYKAHIKGIFGSFARGEESESSDIDVLVDFKEGADLFDFVGLSLFLEENFAGRLTLFRLIPLRMKSGIRY